MDVGRAGKAKKIIQLNHGLLSNCGAAPVPAAQHLQPPLAQLAGYVSCRDLVASVPSDELQTPRTAGDPDTTACCPLPDYALLGTPLI